MGFLELTKLAVKKRASFTCCWCRDREKKVEVHHIIPQAEGGSDDEANAAPLCGSCHQLYGANPDLRKEIRLRRNHLYEYYQRMLNHGWPLGLDVPLLSFCQRLPPTDNISTPGIQLTDRHPGDPEAPPRLYVAVFFKTSRSYTERHPVHQKWLLLESNMRFAFSMQTHVRAWNHLEVLSLMFFLTRGDEKYWYLEEKLRNADPRRIAEWRLYGISDCNLCGPLASNMNGTGNDLFRVWTENGENRLMMSAFTPTHAMISIQARFSDEMAMALATYLEEVGFAAWP